LELTNNGQPLPLLTFSGTSDLPFLATEFVQTHDIRDAHSVSCADQPCTIAALINSMERLLAPSRPPLPFPPAYPSLPPLSPPLDPLDIPRSVCELLTWAGTDRPPILAAERDLFCSTKYRLPSHLCENLLSDLCQLSLAALDPDEQIPVDIKLLSESPTSIISEKRRKLFNDSDVLEVHLKRKEINDWQDRVFGRVLCMVPARAGSERLRLKNMRLIGGKPMVEHAIQKALESGVCDRVVVNSDNDMFRPLAVRNGAEFYLRPLALGSSTTKADDVVCVRASEATRERSERASEASAKECAAAASSYLREHVTRRRTRLLCASLLPQQKGTPSLREPVTAAEGHVCFASLRSLSHLCAAAASSWACEHK
jgi:hypothetical protein